MPGNSKMQFSCAMSGFGAPQGIIAQEFQHLHWPQAAAEEAAKHNSWFRNLRAGLNSSFLLCTHSRSICAFFRRIHSQIKTTKLTLISSKRTSPNPNSQLSELKGETFNGFKNSQNPVVSPPFLTNSVPWSFNTTNCLGQQRLQKLYLKGTFCSYYWSFKKKVQNNIFLKGLCTCLDHRSLLTGTVKTQISYLVALFFNRPLVPTAALKEKLSFPRKHKLILSSFMTNNLWTWNKERLSITSKTKLLVQKGFRKRNGN